MTKDARDLIEYMKQAMSADRDEYPNVVITEGAASNIVNELEFLLQRLEQANRDIQTLIAECDRLTDEIADLE